MLDVLIRNGFIVDGSGKPGFNADLGIAGDRIALMGPANGAVAARELDANGKIVCPGFVDPHSHADLTIFRRKHAKMLEPLVRQGITSFVGGNCGVSVAPMGAEEHRPQLREFLNVFMNLESAEEMSWNSMGEYLAALERRGMLLNMAALAPHGIMRIGRMGSARRQATEAEVRLMADDLDRCMDEGAIGFSAGLQYYPGSQSDTSEIVALGKVAKKHDGIFACHLRSYGKTLARAVDEVIEVAHANDIRAQVSHIFWTPEYGPFGPLVRSFIRQMATLSQWWTPPLPLDGVIAARIEQVMAASRNGAAVGMDVMPSTTAFTFMLAFFPPWVLEGSADQVLKRLQDRSLRPKIRQSIEKSRARWPHVEGDTWSMNLFGILGWESMLIMAVASEKNQRYVGMRLVDVAREQGKHPCDAACDLIIEERGNVLAFISVAEPDDNFTERTLFASLRHPDVSISTDTILLGLGKPSQLYYGCYPKFIGRYVRDMKLLPLEAAIRKCTSLPADHFRLKDRGTLKEGAFADLVVFDLGAMASRTSFEKPDQFPAGIEHVFINGHHVVEADQFRPDPLPGRVLRKSCP